MKKKGNSKALAMSISLFCLVFVSSAECIVSKNSQSQIKVLGSCSKYFKEGKQIKRFPRNALLRCQVMTSIIKNGNAASRADYVLFQTQIDRRSGRPIRVKEHFGTLDDRGKAKRTILASGDRSDSTALLLSAELLELRNPPIIILPTPFATTTPTPSVTDPCEPYYKIYFEELEEIQKCSNDSECGQQISFGCGCTRNKVARKDADPSTLYEISRSMPDGCGLVTTCDCPEVDGFKCDKGRCNWNYL